MEALFLKLLNMSVTAAYLVAAILILRFFLKKAPRWITCSLWGLVALRLICPFSFESIFSLIPSKDFLPKETVNAFSSFTPTVSQAIEYAAKNPVKYDLVIDKSGGIVFSEFSAPDNVQFLNPLLIFTIIFSVIWVVGIIGMLTYALISYIRLHGKVRESLATEGNIYICDNIDTPFILGIFRPRVYLPSKMNEADREYVIAHEKAHMKRFDHLWKPLGFFILSVYWFNPVLWLAYILLCRDIEFACDEKVIKSFGKEIKKPYSNALINCSAERKMISACPVAFGETGVKARIKSVLSYKKPAFWVILVSVIVCVITAVCFGTSPKISTLPNGAFYAGGNDIMNPYIDISVKDKTISLGVSGASYTEQFTYKETADGIELYDRDGNKTAHTIEVQKEGVIFDGVGYISPSDELDKAVHTAIINEFNNYSDECFTEGHIILGIDNKKNDIYKVYLLVTPWSFGFENDCFVNESGAAFACIMTFKYEDSYYILKNIKLTEEGELLTRSVKKLFPSEYHDRILKGNENDSHDMWLQCKEQAKAYLDKIGRTAIICKWSDIEHISFSDIGMPLNVSNHFDSILKWDGYYDYIGYKEVIENGKRYVYRTVFEERSKTLVFTKEDKSTDEIIKYTRIDVKTGRNLGEMPQSLKSIYPDYYDLSIKKGLTVYVWKTLGGDYCFSLAAGDDERDLILKTDPKPGLLGVSLNDMREIISSYDISESDVTLVPINHPLSSYIWDYEREFGEKVNAEIKGMLCAYLVESPLKAIPEKEYNYLTEDFFGSDDSSFNIARQFLTSNYDDVRYIDFYSLFYNGIPGKNAVSSDEVEALGGDDMCPFTKASAEDIDEVMRKYTGVSAEDTNKKNLHLMIYLRGYDSYYNQHGDTNCPSIVFTGGFIDEDGFIYLSYNGKCSVKLRKTQSGEYFIVSNYNPGYEEIENEPVIEEDEYKYLKKLFESDIDGDLVKEDIYFSYGPTSGIYTFVLSARKKNSDVYYYKIFSPMEYSNSERFIMKDGKPCYVTEDEDGNEEYFYITVKDGNIALIGTGGEISGWGTADPVMAKAFMTGVFSSDYFNEENRRGINMYAKDVTDKGLTLVYTQAEEYGDGTKTPKDEIITGEAYFIEAYKDGNWVKLTPKDEEIFSMIAYLVPRGKEAELKVNWSQLYGRLENSYKAGPYRIGKKFTLTDKSGRQQEKTVFAYFAVYD